MVKYWNFTMNKGVRMQLSCQNSDSFKNLSLQIPDEPKISLNQKFQTLIHANAILSTKRKNGVCRIVLLFVHLATQ